MTDERSVQRLRTAYSYLWGNIHTNFIQHL